MTVLLLALTRLPLQNISWCANVHSISCAYTFKRTAMWCLTLYLLSFLYSGTWALHPVSHGWNISEILHLNKLMRPNSTQMQYSTCMIIGEANSLMSSDIIEKQVPTSIPVMGCFQISGWTKFSLLSLIICSFDQRWCCSWLSDRITSFSRMKAMCSRIK